MKPRYLLITLFLGLGLSAFAQGGKCIPFRADGAEPYAAGEKLTFTVSYNWHAVQTDVAKATLEIDQEPLNGQTVWHSKMSAVTAPFFDVFFKIREYFDSWFALEGVEPYKFTRETQEGNYHASNLFLYDRPAGVIHATVKCGDQEEQSLEIPFKECTYDLTTLLYFVRRMDVSRLTIGEPYGITFAIDDIIGITRLTYQGKERTFVKGLGTVDALKFNISVNSGEVFDGKDQAVLWISDDDNRLPVAFMAPLKVGAMNGRLKSYEGLAHEFTSLVSVKRVK